jgi:hypothetical protein
VIKNLRKFEDSFAAWWSMLQPAFVGEYASLKTAGKNGFFTIILLLCWWGCSDRNSAAWITAVNQAANALDHMLGRKHPSPPPDDFRSKKRS